MNFIGPRFKKIAYPLGLATVGATVCYLVQSVIIANVTGSKAYAISQQIYEAFKSLWTKSTKKESLPEHKGKTKLGIPGEIEIPAKTTNIVKQKPEDFSFETMIESTTGTTPFMPDPKFMDHGQSCPEDEDMYSTRS